jgi:hypothetical protein
MEFLLKSVIQICKIIDNATVTVFPHIFYPLYVNVCNI